MASNKVVNDNQEDKEAYIEFAIHLAAPMLAEMLARKLSSGKQLEHTVPSKNDDLYFNLPVTLTAKEAAEFLRCSTGKIYEMCRLYQGRFFPHIRLGSRAVIPRAGLIQFIESGGLDGYRKKTEEADAEYKRQEVKRSSRSSPPTAATLSVEKKEKRVKHEQEEKAENSRLTLNEAAKYAKVSKYKMRQMIEEHIIPCHVLSGSDRSKRFLIPTATLNDWLSSNGKITYCEMVVNYAEREGHSFFVSDKSSHRNFITMPLKINVSQGREGWELTNCPECGKECWLLPQNNELLKYNDDYEGFFNLLCTECSLNKTY